MNFRLKYYYANRQRELKRQRQYRKENPHVRQSWRERNSEKVKAQITKPPMQVLDDPWKSHHDLKTTKETIKHLLAGGTPNWFRWPKDYKAFAQEMYLADKEVSETMASRYKMENQEELLNEIA